MQNIRLTLEYNGRDFHGWQRQPGVRTVQGELERVLQMVLRTEIVELFAAGRTDAGVHARGQVINFLVDLPAQKLPDLGVLRRSVSSILRGEVAVLAADYVDAAFNARFDARYKQYVYRIMRRDVPPAIDRDFVWHINAKLDVKRMQEEARALVGKFDFSSFRGEGCNAASPVKEIFESEIIEEPPYITYRVVGRGFLKHMVRNIVGTLAWMGKGMIKQSMSEIIAAKDRRVAGITAPASGLFMDRVSYEEYR